MTYGSENFDYLMSFSTAIEGIPYNKDYKCVKFPIPEEEDDNELGDFLFIHLYKDTMSHIYIGDKILYGVPDTREELFTILKVIVGARKIKGE